jgi:hypothetical protein
MDKEDKEKDSKEKERERRSSVSKPKKVEKADPKLKDLRTRRLSTASELPPPPLPSVEVCFGAEREFVNFPNFRQLKSRNKPINYYTLSPL